MLFGRHWTLTIRLKLSLVAMPVRDRTQVRGSSPRHLPPRTATLTSLPLVQQSIMRNTLILLSLVLVAAWMPTSVRAQDEGFSVVVNPTTGAARLRNDSNTAIDIDGYLLVAEQDVFAPGNWSSLKDNQMQGWQEGQSTDLIIGEVNLDTALTIPVGGDVAIGAPYDVFTPSAIGEPEPEFGITYSVAGVGVFRGELEFESRNNVVLRVNPTTGALHASWRGESRRFDATIGQRWLALAWQSY